MHLQAYDALQVSADKVHLILLQAHYSCLITLCTCGKTGNHVQKSHYGQSATAGCQYMQGVHRWQWGIQSAAEI